MPGNPNQLRVGAGWLYIAPVGATEPTDLTTAWETVDPNWVALGYTQEGHRFAYTPSYDGIDVAEELDPVRYEPSGRELAVGFAMAEITARNLQIAFNGGTITPPGTGQTAATFEPPELGEETRVAIGWESVNAKERWVYRKALQTGTADIARRKSPTKATIPADFRLEVVQGAKPFKALIFVES